MTHTPTGRRARRRLRALPLPARPADALDADLAVRIATVALVDHPDAVVDRVEVEPSGRYTAHLVTRAGVRVVVRVDRDLTVTGWIALAR